MKRDYDSTVARIAGNIAAGLVTVGKFRRPDDSINTEDVTTVAVELARRIVVAVSPRSVSLQPFQDPQDIDAIEALVRREARWFEFEPALDLRAAGPSQWCYVATVADRLVGFGRLNHQQDLDVLVCGYGVLESERRRGYGRQILSALAREAAAKGMAMLAGVLPDNTASIELCRWILGDALWTGTSTATGRPVVVFGDQRARDKFSQQMVPGKDS